MKLFLYLTTIFCILLTTINAKDLHIVTSEYPPYEYLEKGQAIGINVDIATEALKRIGYTAKIEFIPWQRALFYTKYGKADAILDASYKDDRAKYLNYPKEEVYLENWYCFKPKNSKITLNKNLSNIPSIRIGIMRNYFYGGEIQKAIDKKLFKKIVQLNNEETIFKKLFDKKYDIFIGNKTTTYLVGNKLGLTQNIEIVKTTETNENYLLSVDKTYLAFSKKAVPKELVKKFSEAIAQMKKDGTVDKILKKYF